jgi:hypothetical protein
MPGGSVRGFRHENTRIDLGRRLENSELWYGADSETIPVRTGGCISFNLTSRGGVFR